MAAKRLGHALIFPPSFTATTLLQIEVISHSYFLQNVGGDFHPAAHMRQSWCESYRSGPETEVRVPRRALYGFDPTRLTEVRRERGGLSRSDLGRLSSVTYNTVRNWETGESAPSPSTLERVAEVLGVTVHELAVVPEQAQTLASWRTRRGLAQSDIAQELGMSKSTYSRLERGERSPDE